METQNKDLVTVIRDAHQANVRSAVADAMALDREAGEDRVRLCVEGIVSKYEVLQSHVRHELRMGGMVQHREIDKEQLKDDTERGNERIRQATDEERVLSDRKMRLEPLKYDWSNYKWRPWVHALFFAGEIVINGYACTVVGGPLITGFVIAAVIAVSLSVTAFFIGRRYQEAEGEERKAFVRKSAICMTAVFLCLSILRATYAFSRGEMRFSGSVAGGTLIFLILNLIIFFAAIVFSTTLPTSDERRLKHMHDDVTGKLSACRVVIEREREAMRGRREANAYKTRERIDKASDARYYADLIKGYRIEAVQAFYRERELRGTDFMKGLK